MNKPEMLKEYLSKFVDTYSYEIRHRKMLSLELHGEHEQTESSRRSDEYFIQELKENLYNLVSENFDNAEIAINELEKIGKDELKAAFKIYITNGITRPCCSNFPGIWPFCNKNC